MDGVIGIIALFSIMLIIFMILQAIEAVQNYKGDSEIKQLNIEKLSHCKKCGFPIPPPCRIIRTPNYFYNKKYHLSENKCGKCDTKYSHIINVEVGF